MWATHLTALTICCVPVCLAGVFLRLLLPALQWPSLGMTACALIQVLPYVLPPLAPPLVSSLSSPLTSQAAAVDAAAVDAAAADAAAVDAAAAGHDHMQVLSCHWHVLPGQVNAWRKPVCHA